MQRMSKGFFIGSFIAGFVLFLIFYSIGYALMLVSMANNDRDPPFAAFGMMCFAYIPMIYMAVVVAIFVYKIWSAIQDGEVRTTPGKAVGYLFIPLFNLYWIFMAYWGWAQDYNKYISQRNLPLQKVSEGVALGVCVCTLIPCVSIANVVLMPMFMSSAIDAVNALNDARMASYRSA
jgi:hypothetical protein